MSDTKHQIPERVARWLPQARAASFCYGVDPLLLLAICDRESNGRHAVVSGDGGMGLYQVTKKYHPSFCDAVFGPTGEPLVFDPAFNTLYAAKLFSHHVAMFAGTKVDPSLVAIAAHNASLKRIRAALATVADPNIKADAMEALDSVTTGGNYVTDVIGRQSSYVLKGEEE